MACTECGCTPLKRIGKFDPVIDIKNIIWLDMSLFYIVVNLRIKSYKMEILQISGPS